MSRPSDARDSESPRRQKGFQTAAQILEEPKNCTNKTFYRGILLFLLLRKTFYDHIIIAYAHCTCSRIHCYTLVCGYMVMLGSNNNNNIKSIKIRKKGKIYINMYSYTGFNFNIGCRFVVVVVVILFLITFNLFNFVFVVILCIIIIVIILFFTIKYTQKSMEFLSILKRLSY